MSWPYQFPPSEEDDKNEELADQQYIPTNTQGVSQQYAQYSAQYQAPLLNQQQMYNDRAQFVQQMQQYRQQQYYPSQLPQQMQWAQQPTVPSNYVYPQQGVSQYPQYSQTMQFAQLPAVAGPSGTQPSYLSPQQPIRPRAVRSLSLASSQGDDESDTSRGVSPNASEMLRWGRRNNDGTWSCAWQGCTSRSRFNRGCDLRKHYKRHEKHLFCRVEGCPQGTEGGFSSKKDRDRHEASHNPQIPCSERCGKLFSREDNMVCRVVPVRRVAETDR